MKSSLSAFQKGLFELQLYLNGLDLEKQLISPTGESALEWTYLYNKFYNHHAANRAIKKRYDYNSIIISMYGLVEQYIKALMHDYIESLQKIVPSYSKLPKHILNNHVAVSFELIKQTEQSRYRGTNTKKEIISKLNSCLNDHQRYELNCEAFCHHTANFRSDVVDDFFRKVGISNIMQQTLGNPKFSNQLKDLGLSELRDDIEKTVGKRKKEDRVKSLQERAFYFLNDLADRRNEVAHGLTSDLLDLDILLNYIEFLNAFGNCIYDVLFQKLLKEEVRFIGSNIGKPTNVYKDGYVSCIFSNNVQIKKDDYIVAQNDNELVSGRILEIQIDEVEVNEVAEESSIEMGLRTDCRIKKNHKISIISHEKKIL